MNVFSGKKTAEEGRLNLASAAGLVSRLSAGHGDGSGTGSGANTDSRTSTARETTGGAAAPAPSPASRAKGYMSSLLSSRGRNKGGATSASDSASTPSSPATKTNVQDVSLAVAAFLFNKHAKKDGDTRESAAARQIQHWWRQHQLQRRYEFARTKSRQVKRRNINAKRWQHASHKAASASRALGDVEAAKRIQAWWRYHRCFSALTREQDLGGEAFGSVPGRTKLLAFVAFHFREIRFKQLSQARRRPTCLAQDVLGRRSMAADDHIARHLSVMNTLNEESEGEDGSDDDEEAEEWGMLDEVLSAATSIAEEGDFDCAPPGCIPLSDADIECGYLFVFPSSASPHAPPHALTAGVSIDTGASSMVSATTSSTTADRDGETAATKHARPASKTAAARRAKAQRVAAASLRNRDRTKKLLASSPLQQGSGSATTDTATDTTAADTPATDIASSSEGDGSADAAQSTRSRRNGASSESSQAENKRVLDLSSDNDDDGLSTARNWSRGNGSVRRDGCSVFQTIPELDIEIEDDLLADHPERAKAVAKYLFNFKYKIGLEFLFEYHILAHDATSVAHFLYSEFNLCRGAVGEYLGDPNPFAVEVLKAYSKQFDFQDCAFDTAMRAYLSSFRLPGEAQKIERIIEAFAEQYHASNPGTFSEEDTAFILSFSVVMLHSDLHNKNNKNKMTVEEFIANNRGIDRGRNLPNEFLESIYYRIQEDDFKVSMDHTNLVGQVADSIKHGQNNTAMLSTPMRDFITEITAHVDRKKRKGKSHRMTLLLFNDILLAVRREHSWSNKKSVRQIIYLFDELDVDFADGYCTLSSQKNRVLRFSCDDPLACTKFVSLLQEQLARCQSVLAYTVNHLDTVPKLVAHAF